MNEKEYKNYVTLGKKELTSIEGYQKRICAYAMDVVTIRHGGISKNLYTIKKYADDIGMNPKTLQNWIQIYRNVVIKLEDPDNADFSKASKVNGILEETRTMNNQANGTAGTKKEYKNLKDTPPARVQKLYDEYHEGKPFEGEFVSMMQNLKGYKNLLDKRDLNIINDAHLQNFKDILDYCSSIVGQHLIKKRRAMGRTA